MKQLIFIALLVFIGCKTEKKTAPVIEDWTYLFDGTSTDGWRAYNGDVLPPGWSIQDAALTFNPDMVTAEDIDYQGSKDLIYGAEQFDNFELYVEWKIPAGGNSGIFYHIKEGYKGPPDVSPEYQLIDDVNYANLHDIKSYNETFGALEPEKLQDWQMTAADYAMHVADLSQKVLNPVGQWNSAKIVFTESNVEHWLNGKKVLSFVPWSEDWYKKKGSGKWDNSPDYGKFKTGFIGFQDHGSDLAFRNVKIRRL